MENLLIKVFRLQCEAIISDINSNASPNVIELTTNFIVRVYRRMAFIFRLAILLLALYFTIEPVLKYKKLFISLPVQERLAVLKKWQNSTLFFKRKFVMLFLNLTLFAYYDSSEVTDSLGIDRENYLTIL